MWHHVRQLPILQETYASTYTPEVRQVGKDHKKYRKNVVWKVLSVNHWASSPEIRLFMEEQRMQ
jgi:hypothetical protein